jgi:putative FmdB family regulatory protein
MPIFEFTCRGCGQRFETLVTASRRATCPNCKSGDLEKLFSTFATRGAGGATGSAAAPRFT